VYVCVCVCMCTHVHNLCVQLNPRFLGRPEKSNSFWIIISLGGTEIEIEGVEKRYTGKLVEKKKRNTWWENCRVPRSGGRSVAIWQKVRILSLGKLLQLIFEGRRLIRGNAVVIYIERKVNTYSCYAFYL